MQQGTGNGVSEAEGLSTTDTRYTTVIMCPEPANMAHITDEETLRQQLSEPYPGVFNGVGKLKDAQVHVHIDPVATPVAQKQHTAPFILEPKVKSVVAELLAKDNV